MAAIEAYTITPDSKKLQYEKIQDLSTSGERSIYSDARKKVIALPGVVVGSIIDADVTIKRHKPVIENNFFDNLQLSAGCLRVILSRTLATQLPYLKKHCLTSKCSTHL
ncbi:MAG: DUF3857 domain-containing protein [Dissulfurispiraceae bacterium]